jgi:hypothetical protein
MATAYLHVSLDTTVFPPVVVAVDIHSSDFVTMRVEYMMFTVLEETADDLMVAEERLRQTIRATPGYQWMESWLDEHRCETREQAALISRMMQPHRDLIAWVAKRTQRN